MKVIAVTGYKPHELSICSNDHLAVGYIKKAIARRLLALAEEGLEWVIISGQLGIELWAAEVVYEMQEIYPHLQLAILAPFLQQEERWNEKNREYYDWIVSQADFFDYITKRPYENPVQFRLKNEFILAKSDGLLVVYDEEKEGTPKFIVEMAKKKENYPMMSITFSDIQTIIEEEEWEIDN
ncbi:DUF1273 domain-containing protein [Anoxybacteroides amylolyticum]|uniref:UPF0398 protein GFC30_1824 n=1 Tax=Anoxybacteroides amylolyticum TaxID=294699 RepID=A0A161HUP1_9BACL|nr:DUF1273 domain-containing protein [Anoxybacillus amylolyticus]ANB61384.1 hypothetical protein GFC30_1824 [Anoxybacillus amylolyticus]